MRQVSLLLGKQSYSMLTSLDDDEIREAQEVVNCIMKDTAAAGASGGQERHLAVTCMALASQIVFASKRVNEIICESEQKPQ
ncbi:MAG: hypothetical protein LBQ58_10350 [Synergistaceae bacterium]|jgi:hypothetical protein|nr:hypothetical protein [Synergistaceae bacterium]